VIAAAILLAVAPGLLAAENTVTLSVEGHVRHPQRFDLEALRKLPAEHVQVSFEGQRGVTKAEYARVLLWTMLSEAGGLDDAKKDAELRRTVKVTAKDGYAVVLSTGEIAPSSPASRRSSPIGAMAGRPAVPDTVS